MAGSLLIAVLIHGLLAIALGMGVAWNHDATPVTFSAELWSAIPQQAAPPPPPEVQAPPEPETPQTTPPPPPPEAVRDVDIALAKAKERKEAAARLRAQEQAAAERQALEKKAARAAKAAAEKADAERLANIKKMQALAGGSDPAAAGNTPGSSGSAAQASAPSASYGGRVVAKVKPNIVFTESLSRNHVSDVEVRLAPDGTILSRRTVKASGNPAWDEAVLKALDKTGSFPRDTDGRVPAVMVMGFHSRDAN